MTTSTSTGLLFAAGTATVTATTAIVCFFFGGASSFCTVGQKQMMVVASISVSSLLLLVGVVGVRKEEQQEEEDDGDDDLYCHNNNDRGYHRHRKENFDHGHYGDGLEFLRPGVITGRRRLELLIRYYVQQQKGSNDIPAFYCCSRDEVDDAIVQVAMAASSSSTSSESRTAPAEDTPPVVATPAVPVLIIRVNYSTSVRYERSVCGGGGGGSGCRDPKKWEEEKKDGKCSGSSRNSTYIIDEDEYADHGRDEDRDSSDGVRGAIDIAEYLHRGLVGRKELSPAIRHGVAVILQSETKCLHKLTTWFEKGVVPACRRRQRSLYSMHILQLSRDECPSVEELDAISRPYRALVEEELDQRLVVRLVS